jgi:plasmid maintenance system antidote protein VapI
VLNGKAGVSPRLAIALERLGWSDAGHWVRMQGAYELAQARRADSAA